MALERMWACSCLLRVQAVAERSQSTWAAFKAAVHEEVQSAERGLHKQVGWQVAQHSLMHALHKCAHICKWALSWALPVVCVYSCNIRKNQCCLITAQLSMNERRVLHHSSRSAPVQAGSRPHALLPTAQPKG